MFAKKNNAALHCFLEDIRPASVEEAHAMARGTFSFSSVVAEAKTALPFDVAYPTLAWEKELHSFSWLRHFTKGVQQGETDFVHLARYYIEAWGGSYNKNKTAWQLQTTANRVIAWITNGSLIAANETDKVWQAKLKKMLIQHGKFLVRQAQGNQTNREGCLSAGVALVLLGLSLNGYHHWIEVGFNILMKEAEEQILPDGGHISRNPSQHVAILFDLLTLKKNLHKQGQPNPAKLPVIIDRMLPMLRFFTHGDGKLALFNGGNEERKDLLQAALANDDTGGKPFAFAPHSAYQRLNAGRTLLLVDAGKPPPSHFSQKAHAGCLSMEMSSGKQRFIVNCGNHDNLDPSWRVAMRSTAAHSTLTLENTSSAQQKGRKVRTLSGLSHAESSRKETDKETALEAKHDGYTKAFGLAHHRNLFLDKSGKQLRGEDLLHFSGRKKNQKPKNFAVRFHFHPDVRSGLTHDGKGLMATLANGEGWALKAFAQTNEGSPITPCTLKKEESVYLGDGKLRRAEQVVIAGQTGAGGEKETPTVAKISWMWQRIDKANSS